jgi:hypothetical protein
MAQELRDDVAGRISHRGDRRTLGTTCRRPSHGVTAKSQTPWMQQNSVRGRSFWFEPAADMRRLQLKRDFDELAQSLEQTLIERFQRRASNDWNAEGSHKLMPAFGRRAMNGGRQSRVTPLRG